MCPAFHPLPQGFQYDRLRGHGPRNAPELAARVFERGVTTKGENRGFGLHLVNSIVAQNGGECVIDTEVGE